MRRTWWSAGTVYKLCTSGTESGSEEGEEQIPRMRTHAVQRLVRLAATGGTAACGAGDVCTRPAWALCCPLCVAVAECM